MRQTTAHRGTGKRQPAKGTSRSASARGGKGARPVGRVKALRAAVSPGLAARLRTEIGPGLLALALIAAAAPLLDAPDSTRAWRGYQTLLLRADIAGTETMGSVEARFGPGVVDSRGATVDFWSFDGLESVPLADLGLRIDPSDPRYDPYMAAASGYFTANVRGEEWHVMYLPARMPAAVTWLRLIRVLGFPAGGAWRLIELDPIEKGLSLAAILCVAPLLAFSRGKSRRTEMHMALAGALIWIPCILAGGVSCLALAVLLFMAWHPLMQVFVPLRGWNSHLIRDARPPLRRYLAVAAIGCVLLLPADRFSLRLPLLCLCPVSASLLTLAGIAWLKGGAAKHRKRRVKFEPIPIVRSSKNTAHGRTAARLLALLALACIGCVPLMRGVRFPLPLPALGAPGFSWESLAALSRGNRPGLLPGYADLVTHEAYQQTLAFGRPWRTPVRDERVYVRDYLISPEEGRIQARQKTVKVFDSTWLSSVRLRSRAGTLEALFFRQGRPVAAAMRGPGWQLLLDLPALLGAVGALLFLLIRDGGVGPLIQSILLRFNRRARRNKVP
jgi:hypothetical protein